MFESVLKSYRTGPPRGREQLLGRRRRWWASNQRFWIEVLAGAPPGPNMEPPNFLFFLSHHLTAGSCCEGRLGRVGTFFGVHTSKHKSGQEWIASSSLIPSITLSCKWNKQPGHQETDPCAEQWARNVMPSQTYGIFRSEAWPRTCLVGNTWWK